MIGHTLRVIARGSRDDAGATLLIVQAAQLVEGSALFERGRELKILELQEDMRARDAGQRARVQTRCRRRGRRLHLRPAESDQS
jgi:hypothetical protein